MPPSVDTSDRDAVVRQVRRCTAVQTSVNCHCQLEKHPVGNIEQAAIKLPRAGNDARGSVQYTL